MGKLTKLPIRSHPAYFLSAGRHSIDLGLRTKIMGILNCTPDSFSGDGRLHLAQALRHAKTMIKDGADILDIGGESTRPGARPVSMTEEKKRTIPVIRLLAKTTAIPISIDTYKTEVAQSALDEGATIVNNIMGVKANLTFLKMVRNYNAAIVLMHIRGTPQTMQKYLQYKDLIKEIVDSLHKAIENCLDIGIKLDKIIIDPGIGFAKTVEQNLEIIRHLHCFHVLKRPILIGPSRKSFIGKILNRPVQERLTGTLAAVSACVLQGAQVVRVHDVKEVKEMTTILDMLKETSNHS
jgi:dihydropteroate synthase